MNKWIASAVTAVLVIGIFSYLLVQQTGKLGEARTEIAALEANVSTLQGNVSILQGKLTVSEAEVSSLQGKLTESKATVATLQTDLKTANAEASKLQEDVKTQQNINSTLTTELKKVKDPRHFSSLQELTDWLRKDDTNTKYANERAPMMAYILQVRALRDGYLLPADVDVESDAEYWSNSVVIGDSMYYVYAWNDETEKVAYIRPLPSHPLPLD